MASFSSLSFLKSRLSAKSRLFNVKFHFGHKILYLKLRLYVKSRFVKSRLHCTVDRYTLKFLFHCRFKTVALTPLKVGQIRISPLVRLLRRPRPPAYSYGDTLSSHVPKQVKNVIKGRFLSFIFDRMLLLHSAPLLRFLKRGFFPSYRIFFLILKEKNWKVRYLSVSK